MLFVWQAPLMSLSYAIICFVAGLAAVIVSPLIDQPRWGNGARVSVLLAW